MKVTTPEEMSSGTDYLEIAIAAFEKKFESKEKDEDYYHLVISGEYNRITCDEIERLYKEAGWKKVICKTSSEKGERGGLTGLQLFKY